MGTKKLSSDKEVNIQLNNDRFFDAKENISKRIFCPVCERNVPLSFTVAGMCKDCFNND